MIQAIIAGIKAIGAWAAEHWAAVAIASTAYGGYQQYEARKDAKAAQDEARKARLVDARRKRIAALQEKQRTMAALRNTAAQTGTVGSSGVSGAVSSVESQYGANYGAEKAFDKFSRASASFENQANLKTWRAGQASTFTSFMVNEDVRKALTKFGGKG